MRALITVALLLASVGVWAGGGFIMDPATLPEPGTLGLLAAGAFAAYKLRKKK